MDLLDRIAHKSIVIVLGDGGVGKTSVAAALAALAAASGRRVLAVTVDPSNRLRDALGLRGPPGEEEEVPLLDFDAKAGGFLRAMVLDAATELERLAREAGVQGRITDHVFFRKAATRLAGAHEYAAFARVADALESSRYDLVVLDTPPERHALDFIDAPSKLDTLLGQGLLDAFIGSLSRAGTRTVRFRRLVLLGVGRLAGEDTFISVLNFLLDLVPVYESYRTRAARVRQLFATPACAAIVVCRPGRPVGSIAALRARGIEPAAVLANRVLTWPSTGGHGMVDAAIMKDALALEPALGLLDRDALSALATRLLHLAQVYRERANEDAVQVARLRDAVAPVPVHVVSELGFDLSDLRGLAHLARALSQA